MLRSWALLSGIVISVALVLDWTCIKSDLLAHRSLCIVLCFTKELLPIIGSFNKVNLIDAILFAFFEETSENYTASLQDNQDC